MDPIIQNVVLIGAGNLATHLGKALKKSEISILQVYSRTFNAASSLAKELNCEATNDINLVKKDAQVYIFAVKDSALDTLIPPVARLNPKALFLHTAGSMPMQIFKSYVSNYGVLYPMQTFSKTREVDFSTIPCFIESSSEENMTQIRGIATRITNLVYELSSEKRQYLHLAAVFACNFTNHLYTLSAEILQKEGIPFSVMNSLIDETAYKVHALSPLQAQTGPALRYDRNVIETQLNLLKNYPLIQEIYELLSKSIHDHATNNF